MSIPGILLTVRDTATGAPLEGVAVRLFESLDYAEVRMETDSDGACRLAVSESDPHRVCVRLAKQGYVPQIANLSSSTLELRIDMEKARTIGGLVLDGEDRPVSGAEVLVTIRGSSGDGGQEIHHDLWEVPVRTDGHGRWQFDGAPAALEPISIRIFHPAFVSGLREESRPAPAEFLACTAVFRITKGRRIEGTVRNPAGEPLAGVDVLMHEHGSDSTTKPRYATDAHGRYFIENAPARTRHRSHDGVLLTFFKGGFSPEIVVVPPGTQPQRLDITLPSGNRLCIRVTDAEGNPLPGVHVCPDGWRGYRPFRRRFRTDADGRFVWEDAPADEVIFDLLRQGFMAMRGLPLRASEQEHHVVMRRPVVVTGRVVDAVTRQAVPEFKVLTGMLWDDGRTLLGHGRARDRRDSEFRLKFSEPSRTPDHGGRRRLQGAHVVAIHARGYLPAVSRPIEDTEDLAELTFELEPGEETAFHILTKDRKPVAGADVAVWSGGNPIFVTDGLIRKLGDNLAAVSDSEGKIVLPAMRENPVVVVAHPEFGFAASTLETLRQGSVTLSGWGRVVIHSPLVTKDGTPPFYLDDANLDPDRRRDRAYSFSRTPSIPCDGVQVFERVVPGPVRIGIFRRDAEKTVVVPADDEIVVAFEELRESVTISGKLSPPTALPAIDWTRQEGLLESNGAESRAVEIAEGAYRIHSVPPGKHWLRIPVFTDSGVARTLLGAFEAEITVLSFREMEKLMGREEGSMEDSMIELKIDPAFRFQEPAAPG